MRKPRIPGRPAVRRAAAATLGGVFAVALLTGCLGEKDDGASGKPSASASGKATGSPKGTPGGSTAAPSGGLPSQVEAISLKKGDCITSSSSGDISKKPCTGPHTAEVVATYTLADGDSPMDLDFDEKVSTKCESLVTPTLNRQPDKSRLTIFMYQPTVSSYIRGDREVSCLIVRKDDTPLTAPLV